MMRNAPGATVIAPYSLRGRPAALVSVPIGWAEVEDPSLRPDGFTRRSVDRAARGAGIARSRGRRARRGRLSVTRRRR
jgi:DNA primase